ncbi:MAG TPA: hypothetical protein VK920_00155 [Solirubrobacterales bacterium]|nr:hypothetical protein [Solirubrobacterales bacterium]
MTEDLQRAAERLRQIAAELGDPEIDDGQAEELAREAAELAAQAGSAAAATLRESAGAGDE